MLPKDFIAAIAPAARASMAKTNIPASFVIAEGALESGWGEHAPGMNLFGVKADAAWKGAVTRRPTREYVHGQPVIIEAAFRAYPTWDGSIEDHAVFLCKNDRYKPAFEHSADAIAFTEAVDRAGYATDPNYAAKIISVIRAHDLTQFDKREVTA